MTTPAIDSSKPVLHVVVIGFHHKKGCQVEYAFPPLIPGGQVNSNEAPIEWKHLPSLAIPDGAHNYTSDSIYFHLPAREGINRTVYGVACYRQIEAKDLKIKTQDITRSTVQKSVCVLSYLPLYGLIEAKLELITHAYFKELDFSQVSLLEETYNNLNASLTESLLDGGSQVYLGMKVKDLVHTFRHKIVMLFKLVLLERRVLFTGSPVEKLGNSILSVLSLYPGMIEHGLVECTSYGIHRHISPTLTNTKVGSESDTDDYLEIRYSEETKPVVNLYSESERVDSVEPSSPTMDRGLDRPYFHDSTLHNDNSIPIMSSQVNNNIDSSRRKLKIHSAGKLKNTDKKDSSNNLKLDATLRHGIDQGGENPARNHKEDGLEYVDDYYTKDNVVNTQCDKIGTTGSSDDMTHQQVVLAGDSEILTGVTSYQAVQAGKSIPKKESVINIEEISEHSLEMEEDYFGSLPKESFDETSKVKVTRSRSSKSDLEGEELVEELDSPESISQIDQEDCFSWEEDNLSLTINTDKPSLDMSAGLASSFKDMPTLERAMSSGSQHSREGDKEGLRLTDKEGMKGGTSEVVDKTASIPESPSGNNGLSPGIKAAAIKNKLSNAFSGLSLKGRLSRSKPSSRETSQPPSPAVPELPPLPILQQDDMGFPLAVFTKGCVCFPYLSLQYYDLLNDINVRSFLIGATNMLFRQKRHLTDVVVDVSENKLEIHDRELQKQLILTTADLRFADILVKAVTGINDEGYFEGTEWEGNDEWLRAQFKLYLEGMLAAVHSDDHKLLEDFGVSFIQCWKTTHNYKVWSNCDKPALKMAQAGHPCQGNLSVTDIRVRFSHTMHNTEGGKKINAAVSQTGKYVVQTGKAVGGALTQAKSSLSSWFGTWKSSEKRSPEKTNSSATKDIPQTGETGAEQSPEKKKLDSVSTNQED